MYVCVYISYIFGLLCCSNLYYFKDTDMLVKNPHESSLASCANSLLGVRGQGGHQKKQKQIYVFFICFIFCIIKICKKKFSLGQRVSFYL